MPAGLPTVQVQVLPAAKPWWQSKTLWLNALVLLLAGAEAQLGLLQPLLPVNVYALVAFGLPLANGLLRLVTAQRLAFKAQEDAAAAAAAARAAQEPKP